VKAGRHGQGPRFRRSPQLVAYWTSSEGFVLENFATGRRLAASSLAVEILDFFSGWKTCGELARRFPRHDGALLEQAVGILAHGSFLDRADGRRASLADDVWSPWNPAAGFLHFSTKDVPFVRESDAWPARMRRRARTEPMPPAVKPYPRSRRVALPEGRADGELPATLLARRTWRRFGSAALAADDLSTLLGLTFRIQAWMPVAGVGRMPLKTAPSGGARHSIEAYVLARRVRGLDPGLYHYAPDRHGLDLLRRGATSAQIERYLPSQWWFRGAAAVVFMTSVFPRVAWRYRYPRAYRAVLIEAGHLCQTFLLMATRLGLAPFCTMALADSRIERDLEIDGVTESVLYAAGVGTRPAGVESAQAPAPRRR
jgi:SagB-type dehydrogenase family enzyme